MQFFLFQKLLKQYHLILWGPRYLKHLQSKPKKQALFNIYKISLNNKAIEPINIALTFHEHAVKSSDSLISYVVYTLLVDSVVWVSKQS